MPIYEYSCPSCGQTFEVKLSFDKFSEALPCPKCSDTAPVQLSLFNYKLGWVTPTHNKDPFNPLPQGYTPGNVREI